jgi:uncharacterized repeat protein (TIGR01451 family)
MVGERLRLPCVLAIFSVCISISWDGAWRHATPPSSARVTGVRRPEAARANRSEAAIRNLAQLPLSFEPNRGQANGVVKFLSHGSGYTLFFTRDEAVFTTSSQGGPASALGMKVVGSNPAPQITALDKAPGISNYFIGNDARNWRTAVPHYAKIKYREIYPGVDLVYYGTRRQLEFDFVVGPGADPERIRVRFSGTTKTEIDAGGDLLVRVERAEMRFRKPVVYQAAADDGASRDFVDGQYVLTSEHEIAFRVAGYDRQRTLVIDPVLSYSTFLGAGNFDSGNGIAVDSAGSAYVTGETASTDFPVAGAYQGSNAGTSDVFVTKLDPTGTTLVYSTYLGGSLADRGNSIAVDAGGNACITGRTNSAVSPIDGSGGFPLSHPWNSQLLGDYDAFVAKLSADGSALLFSTYFGGSGNDEGAGIAVDSSGMIYVTGGAGALSADDFPTTQGAFQRLYGGGMNDAFVAKFDPTQSGPGALVYSTFLGGGDKERGNSIAVDSAGNAYVTGRTGSSDFPLSNPLQSSYGGGFYDAFVTELSADATNLIYSTFLGNVGTDQAYGIAVDSAGNAYVAGVTDSSTFPTINAYQPMIAGSTDAFVAEISAGGGALLYSTYFGGSGADLASGLALDASGTISITGRTASQSSFPTTQDAIQPTYGGGPHDAFVAKLNTAQSGQASLVYSSYLGGGGDEDVPSPGVAGNPSGAIAVDLSGNAYVTGNTTSGDFRTVNPYQATNLGAIDAFVTVIGNATTPDYAVSVTPASVTVPAGSAVTYTVTVTPVAGFTGTVSLVVGGAPPDAVASFDPSSVVITNATAQTSTLTVNTATSTGTFPLTITGTVGALQHASMVNLVITTNLVVTMGGWPSPVAVGTNLTYEIRVTNQGPAMAADVQVNDMLPAAIFGSPVSTQGMCSGTDTVTCDLGPLDVGSRATVTIVVSPFTAGSISNTAMVTADQWISESATSTVDVVQSGAGGVPVDVLQHHLHATRDGLYVDPLITPQTATMTHRELSFSVSVPGPVYAQPLYITNGPGGSAAYIVATEQNIVVAIDASDGTQLWQSALGTPAPRSALNCGDIDPLGITGTPVIDPDARLILVDAMTTPDAGATKQHLIFALSLDDGSVTPGWPVDVNTLSYNGVSFDSSVQNQRGALLLNAGMLYVPYGGHFGDCNDFDGTPYHGWVVAVPETNPAGAVAWATAGNQAGIWAVGGLSTDGTSMFAATGNTAGTTTTWAGGEAILRLGLDDTFSGNAADFFTPSNWRILDTADLDLGGEAPLIVDVPGATPSQLIVALGKSGVAHLLDRNNLGGFGAGDGQNGEGLFSTQVAIDNPPGTPQRGRIRTAGATYTIAAGPNAGTYVVFSVGTPGSLGVGCPSATGDLVALRISASSPPTISVAWCANDNGTDDNGQPAPFAGRGAPIVTTPDGSSQPVVWTIGAEGTNRLLAYDGEMGAPLFASDHLAQVRRFMTPIAVNGRIIVVSDNTLYVFNTR